MPDPSLQGSFGGVVSAMEQANKSCVKVEIKGCPAPGEQMSNTARRAADGKVSTSEYPRDALERCFDAMETSNPATRPGLAGRYGTVTRECQVLQLPGSRALEPVLNAVACSRDMKIAHGASNAMATVVKVSGASLSTRRALRRPMRLPALRPASQRFDEERDRRAVTRAHVG